VFRAITLIAIYIMFPSWEQGHAEGPRNLQWGAHCWRLPYSFA
jgi:hypothetical protein